MLLLRDNKSARTYPNQWTLIGGNVRPGESPETTARRELEEETGVKSTLTFWKRYAREHTLFVVDQYIFVGTVSDSRTLLVLGRDTQFFKPSEIEYLKIGYGFKELLSEYFLHRDLTAAREPHTTG